MQYEKDSRDLIFQQLKPLIITLNNAGTNIATTDLPSNPGVIKDRTNVRGTANVSQSFLCARANFLSVNNRKLKPKINDKTTIAIKRISCNG